MTRKLFSPYDPEVVAAAPRCWLDAHDGKKLLRVVWDEAGGYPEHAWGYTQWSLRPYEQWYGCDGTTDANIHLIGWRMCDALGLDYPALYEQAYDDEAPCWLRGFDFAPYEAETIIPPAPIDEVLRGMIHDLHEINNHSLANLLFDTLARLGHDVDYYWLRPGERGAIVEEAQPCTP
jgi:hypothetical protein